VAASELSEQEIATATYNNYYLQAPKILLQTFTKSCVANLIQIICIGSVFAGFSLFYSPLKYK
jgi:hypothetical protein